MQQRSTHEVYVGCVDNAIRRQNINILCEVRTSHIHRRVTTARKFFRHVVDNVIPCSIFENGIVISHAHASNINFIKTKCRFVRAGWRANLHVLKSRSLLWVPTDSEVIRQSDSKTRCLAKTTND